METLELGGFEFQHTPVDYAAPPNQQTRVFGFPLGGKGYNLFWGFDTSCYARITPAGGQTIEFATKEEFEERLTAKDDESIPIYFFDGRPFTGPIVMRGLLEHFENGMLGNYRGDPSQIALECGAICFYGAGRPENKKGVPSVVDFAKGELHHYSWDEDLPTKIEKFNVPTLLRQLMVDRGFWETLEGNPEEDAEDVEEEMEEAEEPAETSSIFPLLLSAVLGGAAALALTKNVSATKKLQISQPAPQNYGCSTK